MKKLFPISLIGGACGTGLVAARSDNQAGLYVSIVLVVIGVAWFCMISRKNKTD